MPAQSAFSFNYDSMLDVVTLAGQVIGLAGIVFIVMDAAGNLPENETLVATVAWTIVLSIVAHCISANPLAKLYGDRVKARGGVT